MKKIIILSFFFLMGTVNFIFSQDEMGGNGRIPPPLEKIQQLEKAKLIEILDLKENTAVRFFARRKEYRDRMRDIFEQRDKKVKEVEKRLKDGDNLSDKECKDQLNEILSIDSKIAQEKEKFYNSLNDILSSQKILKLAVFDNRFMHEIRELLAGRKKGKPD